MNIEELSLLIVTKLEEIKHRRGIAYSAIICRNGEEVLFSSNEGIGGCDDHCPAYIKSYLPNELQEFCNKELNQTAEGFDRLMIYAEKGKSLAYALEQAKADSEAWEQA